MYSNVMSQLAYFIPELCLGIGALILLLLGTFSASKSYKIVNYGAIITVLLALFFVLKNHSMGFVFDHAIYQNLFSRFLKILILLATLSTIILSYQQNKSASFGVFELPILYLLATLGMLLMVCASNMLSLYFGIEIQSLSLYALAAFDRNNIKSSEAGIKYFILGALSSGMLLYGISIIYGYSASIDFVTIANYLQHGTYNIGLIFGTVFMLSALAFKISAAPFHMWSPDVYEGAPSSVTMFLASAAKISAIGLLTNLVLKIFSFIAAPVPETLSAHRQIILILSISSMFLGSFAAIGQSNIKRLMAYSSISHVGYILLALFVANNISITSLLIYLSIYLISTIGIFAFILAMYHENNNSMSIYDLSGLAKKKPLLAIAMSILLASLAGFPPLAGFFAKWYIISPLIQQHYSWLAILSLLSSVISAFYYLRIIKIMWFDEERNTFNETNGVLSFFLYFSAGLLSLYIFIAPWLYKKASMAAASLF